MTRFGLARMIFRILLFVAIAGYLSWFAHSLARAGAPPEVPRWMPKARGILAIGVGFMSLMPFYLERVFTGIAASHMRARGRNPVGVALQVAVVCYGICPVYAFGLLTFGGRPFDVYATSAVCVSGITFWAWRYRGLFRLRGTTS